MLFRCNMCKREFEAAKPACTDCGLDPAKQPRDAHLLVELVTIHFDAPTKVPGRGVGHAACDPRKKVGFGHFSGERRAVSCPACKASPAFMAEDTPPAMPAEILRPATPPTEKAPAPTDAAAPPEAH